MAESGERDQPPAPGARQLVDTQAALDEAMALLSMAPVLGVDVEAGIPPRERQSRFALLQIAVPEHTFAIDPLRLRDLNALGPLMQSETQLKVFHGIALDRDMLESVGLTLRFVTDLSEVARSAFGKGEASLASLARRAFGLGMDKSFQRGNWLHRPLDLPLLAYAWRDAELTLGLYRWCLRELPHLVALHTTLSPRTEIPQHLPEWLKAVLGGSRQSPHELLAAESLDVEKDADRIVASVFDAFTHVRAPFLRGRLMRATGDLELFELSPLLIELLGSPSANERAAAAKSLAAMGELDAMPSITALLDDPTAEVREAAEQAITTLPERALASGDETDPESGPKRILK